MGLAAKKIDNGPELLSISQIAKKLKLDRTTVAGRLEDLGYEQDPSSTEKLKLFPFDPEMEFALKSAKDTVSAMKIRDLRATAQLKEMKLKEQMGELVPMADAVDDMQKIIAWLYQEFTVRQPKRIAPKMARAKNATAIRTILKADTDAIMKNLQKNFEDFLGEA